MGAQFMFLNISFSFYPPPHFFFSLLLKMDVFLKISACHFCLQGPALQKKIVSILYESESFFIEQL